MLFWGATHTNTYELYVHLSIFVVHPYLIYHNIDMSSGHSVKQTTKVTQNNTAIYTKESSQQTFKITKYYEIKEAKIIIVSP